MPIRFSCPHCKKVLAVKDELAGKQGKCPGCRQVIVIPQQHNTPPPSEALARPAPRQAGKPPSKSGIDLEAMAAAALAEGQAAGQESVTVDFTCPWCDTEIHLPSELAGKQAPCTNPECKRIVKVPLLKKTTPRDWRQPDQQTMPSGAKRDEAALEGAWGSQTGGSVSRQALVEAQVIKETREPITVRGWIMRGTVLVVLVAGIVAGLLLMVNYSRSNIEDRGLQLAARALEGPAESLSWEDRAELETALAEYYLRNGQRDASDRPLRLLHLQKSRQAAEQVPAAAAERAFVLRNLLHVQLEAVAEAANQLARAPGEPQETARLERELADTESELADTLGMLPPGIVREDVVRELARAALASGRGNPEARFERLEGLIRRGVRPAAMVRPAPPAGQRDTAASPPAPTGEYEYTEQLNALAILGQELAQAGLKPQAERLADAARRLHKPAQPTPSQLIALLLLLNRQELEGIKAGEPALRGQIAGYIRADNPGEAARLLDEEPLKDSTTPLKAALLMDTAAVLLQKQQLDQAKARLDGAAAILKKYPKDTLVWERCRLLELVAAAWGIEEAERQAQDLLRGTGLNRGKETILRAWSSQNPDRPAHVDTRTAGLDPKLSGCGPAFLLLGRHNGRLDPGETVSWAEQYPAGAVRPFAGIGAVLGMGDSAGP